MVITADCQSYNDFCYVNSYFYDGSDFKEKIYKVYMLFDHYEYDDYDRYFDRRSINE